MANDNSNYEVHIIGNYEGNGHTGFRIHNTGYTNLYMTITGSSSRPLILVLSSYEPIQWTLHIPTGVVLDKVILVSCCICEYSMVSVIFTLVQQFSLCFSSVEFLL